MRHFDDYGKPDMSNADSTWRGFDIAISVYFRQARH